MSEKVSVIFSNHNSTNNWHGSLYIKIQYLQYLSVGDYWASKTVVMNPPKSNANTSGRKLCHCFLFCLEKDTPPHTHTHTLTEPIWVQMTVRRHLNSKLLQCKYARLMFILSQKKACLLLCSSSCFGSELKLQSILLLAKSSMKHQHQVSSHTNPGINNIIITFIHILY